MMRLKRAYEPSAPGDGRRFLVERLWPRGVKKSSLPLYAWLKRLRLVTRSVGGSATTQGNGMSSAVATFESWTPNPAPGNRS
jgi:hypothetical protein